MAWIWTRNVSVQLSQMGVLRTVGCKEDSYTSDLLRTSSSVEPGVGPSENHLTSWSLESASGLGSRLPPKPRAMGAGFQSRWNAKQIFQVFLHLLAPPSGSCQSPAFLSNKLQRAEEGRERHEPSAQATFLLGAVADIRCKILLYTRGSCRASSIPSVLTEGRFMKRTF